MNKRNLQAKNTKKKIYDVGVELLNQNDFEDISVREICKKAGVSIGTFYNYFSSKSGILEAIHKRGDEYFINNIKPKLNSQDSLENIRIYFISYIKFVKPDGVAMLKHLYIPQNKFFIKANRPMHNILKNIIIDGQKRNQIINKISAGEIVNFIFIILRGIIFDWCIHNGQYDIVSYSQNFVEYICNYIALDDNK